MNRRLPKVFISHFAGDKTIADEVRELLVKAVGISEKRVFYTSGGSMGGGVQVAQRVSEGFRAAGAVVAVITPQSVLRSWVLSETGAAHFAQGMPLFLLLARGASFDLLPEPMRLWQGHMLTRENDIREFCQALRRLMHTRSLTLSKRRIQKVISAAKQAEGSWDMVKPTPVARQADGSPFCLLNVLKTGTFQAATREIHLLGQNLWNLTKKVNQQTYQTAIFNWLSGASESGARKFVVTICDGGCRKTRESLAHFLEPKAVKHLAESLRVFGQWSRAARRQHLAFECRTVRTLPPNIMFVDPDPNSLGGYLVLTPLVKPFSADRPHFVVGHKENPTVFAYYWNAYWEKVRSESKELTV